ncbi:MAG: outer membrane protein assembly factor BamC, partial [Pseudohongiellaceae bacterium]
MSIFSKTFQLVCMLSGALLSACSIPLVDRLPGSERFTGENALIRDRQGEYLQAETIPRTRIPAGMDSYIIDDLYVIPELRVAEEPESFLDVPRPRPLQGRSERGVVIQRIEDRSWVVVDASPSQVWPRIRDYWRGQSVELSMENPTAGIMDTSWFVEEGNSLTQEKFRITVEPGFQNESTEIKLLHLALPQAVPAFDQVTWPESSTNQDKEYARLNDLSVYLADVADLYQASAVSFLAGSIPSKGKASLVESRDGLASLRLEADFVRSWAAVGRALERAGVEVVSQDQQQAVYDVSYTIPGPEEEEKGWLGKLLPGGRKSDRNAPHYELR